MPITRSQSNAKTMSMLTFNRRPMREHLRPIVERFSIPHSPPLYPPLVDKLPMELIQIIFSLACPKVLLDPKGTAVPFHSKLGLVCKKWRAVVVGHRSLWAAFTIEVPRRWNPRFGTYLRNYLQQSGTCPLTIQVQGGSESDEVVCNILDTIVPHCERWAAIKLDFILEYRFLLKLKAVRDRLPLLQRLHIEGPLEPYPTKTRDLAIFRNTPSLSRLSVLDIDPHSAHVLALPWTRISRAKLDFASFRKFQSSLEQSEALTTLTLTEESSNALYNVSTWKPPVTLKELQVLRVREELDVGHFVCPSLRRLEVIHEDSSDICKLLDNSSCSLVHLELQGPGKASLSPIIQHASLAGLTFLHLEGGWIDDGAMNILVLDSRRLLPLLKMLHVDVDLESCARQTKKEFKSHIKTLHCIVESRTYARHDIRDNRSNLNAITPLKEFHLMLTDFPPGWVELRDKTLQCLRCFCNSRNILALLPGFAVGKGHLDCSGSCYYATYGDSDESDDDESDNYNNFNYYSDDSDNI